MEEMLLWDKTVMKCEKLVYDFTPKVAYDIYAPALKWLMLNDMITLDKIISYLPCKFEYIMSPFIEAMTDRRIEAQKLINQGKRSGDAAMKKKGETLKDFYKLINNSSYGKTTQDDEKFHKTGLSTKAIDNVNYLNRYIINDCKVVCPPDSSVDPFDEGMCQFTAINPLVRIKSPHHMGSAILWNSKMVMLNFLYNCLLVHCPETEIYYTDTDSVHIKMKYINAHKSLIEETKKKFNVDYKTAAAIASLYERFPEDVRAKFFPTDMDDIVAGKMKVDGIFFEGAEGIYLKAKTYIESNAGKIDKVHDKGVSLIQNKSLLTLDRYRDVLYNHKAYMGSNEMIRKIQGKRGQYMASVLQRKWILDPFYDKRYEKVDDNGIIITYPYGYHLLENCKYDHLHFNLKQRIYIFMRNNKHLSAYTHKVRDVRKLVGIDCESLKQRIESQFTEGMHWGNYGHGWNIDHVMPVFALKRAIHNEKVDEAELNKIMAEICHFQNLRPMWKKENSAKGGE